MSHWLLICAPVWATRIESWMTMSRSSRLLSPKHSLYSGKSSSLYTTSHGQRQSPNLFFFFPLYSKGVRLSLHVYITIIFFPHPFFCCPNLLREKSSRPPAWRYHPRSEYHKRVPPYFHCQMLTPLNCWHCHFSSSSQLASKQPVILSLPIHWKSHLKNPSFFYLLKYLCIWTTSILFQMLIYTLRRVEIKFPLF